MKVFQDISNQWNRQRPNAKYYAPVNGLMYFQVPCEVDEVQIVDVALNTMVILSTYNWAYGDIGNGTFVTNIEIDSCEIADSPFYISFRCVNGDFYYTEQFAKACICPDDYLKLEAVRGCEIDFNGIFHGPLGDDATGNLPELQYKHCLSLQGGLTMPTYTVSYKYGSKGRCNTHTKSTTEQIRFLRAHNFAEWYARELINLVSAKALTIDGTPFSPQAVKIEPNKGTCLYNIDQELQEKSQTFYAACLARCTKRTCTDYANLLAAANPVVNVETVGLNTVYSLVVTNPDPVLIGTSFTVLGLPAGPFTLTDPSTPIITIPTATASTLNAQITFSFGDDCEVCFGGTVGTERGDYPVAVGGCDDCLKYICLIVRIVGGGIPFTCQGGSYTITYNTGGADITVQGSVGVTGPEEIICIPENDGPITVITFVSQLLPNQSDCGDAEIEYIISKPECL